MNGSASKQGSGFRGTFEWFVRSEVAGSVLLLICTLVALAWANSPWSDVYEHLLHAKIGLSWSDQAFQLTVHHWINDGLMVVFFFVVGLEIKRELVVGQLSSFDRAVLPVMGAVGGMVVPAAFYALLNHGQAGAAGWGVPMATDIAFALGALAVFGSRMPIGLKVFLTALAIADDLGAVMVIALFYTEQIRWSALLVAAGFLLVLLGAVRLGIRRLDVLSPLIVGVWVGVFASGVHATVAGILVALVIPVRARLEPKRAMQEMQAGLRDLDSMELSRQTMIDDHRQLNAIERVNEASDGLLPAGLRLEHHLHPLQVWLILPLFALANAGVSIDGGLADTLAEPVALGVVFGLVLGKPIGIAVLSWLAVKSGRGSLPEGVSWGHIVGAGFLAGIGFTMSLFVSELAFADAALVAEAKVGILAASFLSAIAGMVILYRSSRMGNGGVPD